MNDGAGRKVLDPTMIWNEAMPPRVKTVIGGREVGLTATREPLVDTEVLPAGGFPAGQTRTLTFFTRGDGQSVAFPYFGQLFNKTPSDTTMLQGGSLGEPEVFDAYAFAITPEFGTPFEDLVEFYRRAHVIFRFGSTQVVWRIPLRLVTSSVGIDGAAESTARGAHNGWAVSTNSFPISVKGMPRRIFPNEKPSVQMVWDINPEVSKDILVMCEFYGIRYRP